MTALQDQYAPKNECFGCGPANAKGLRIKSIVQGDEVVAEFTPRPEHIALPGFVYGGLLASLVDCHSIGTAAGAAMAAAGQRPGTDPTPRFVTASLQVDFLKPTPMGAELLLRSRAVEVGERKVIVETTVQAGEATVVRGRTVAVRLPAAMEGGGAAGRTAGA